MSAASDRVQKLIAYAQTASAEHLQDLPSEDLATEAEVTALLAALNRLKEQAEAGANLTSDFLGGPLHKLAGQVQNFDPEALSPASGEVPNEVWECVNRLADACDVMTAAVALHSGLTEPLPQAVPDDLAFACKVLALYGHPRIPKFLEALSDAPAYHKEYLWEVMFSVWLRSTVEKSEKLDAMMDSLRNLNATDFLRITYLDFVNMLGHNFGFFREDGRVHPFDSAKGERLLFELIRDVDPEHFSYAHSATASLLFLSSDRRARLATLAAQHPSELVQLEANYARAALGIEEGVKELAFMVTDDELGPRAFAYLEALNRLDAVPDELKGEAGAARREALSWLTHPQEFGCAPDHLEILSPVTLYWPPMQEERQLWPFRYRYENAEGETRDGQGLVGAVTFALRAQTAQLSPEDLIALHCSWESAMNEGLEDWSVNDGWQRLGKHNASYRRKGFLGRLFRA